MNAAGHIAVAAAVVRARSEGADPLTLLGAALPDLAAMGGFRLHGSRAGAAVTPGARPANVTQPLATGISLHHRTDEAFHRHPWFTERNRALYERLRRVGFERGPARACSHVGTELLLDGQLLTDGAVTTASDAAFAAIGPNGAALRPLARTPDPEAWLAHLDRLAAIRLPRDYDQPGAVARRLQRILRRRPRLAFAPALVGALTESLAAHNDTVDDSAAALVDDLVEAVLADPRAALPPCH